MNKQINEIEAIAKKLEVEKDFDTMVRDFSHVAILIKDAMANLKSTAGKITEIIDGVEKLFDDGVE